MAPALFQRNIFKGLNVEIVVIEKALTHAHKVLQDLKIRKQQAFSSLATSSTFAVSQEGLLLVGLMP